MKRSAALVFILAFGSAVHARVFNYKDAGLAAFVRGTGGNSSVGQEPFGNSSGVGTEVDARTRFNYSGEIGVAFNFTPDFLVRLGAEVIQHRPIKDARGVDAAGNERFVLDSDVFVFHPNLTFEFVYANSGNLRLYSSVGAGYAMATVENRYDMSPQGVADYGVDDFNEKMEGTATAFTVATGVETLFTDNVTFSLDVGYRYMPLNALTYKAAVNNIVAPSGAGKGDEALTHSGDKRSMDLGGIFVGMAFRFYLNLF